MDQLFSKHNMLYLQKFAPSTSKDTPNRTIVLQKDYLLLSKDSKFGIPGFFQLPVDDKNLERPSYNLVVKGISFAGHEIVRCIVTPASDITIVPIDLQDCEGNIADKAQTQSTTYILKSLKENSTCMISGYRANVKLGLLLRSANDLTQRFQIDCAVLLDPGLRPQLPRFTRPLCFLGMDFITKYPYLFYVPRFDSCGMVDFMIARDPFASRSYSINEEFYKTVVVYVDGHHNEDTGNIGCGVFFKSGSIFNTFSGVSKYGRTGIKHTGAPRERGVLMAIIKALHVVRAFPVGRDFRGVIIRSADPIVIRLMAVTQVTMKNVFTDSVRDDGDDPMEEDYYYPTANRDLLLYFCHTFLRTALGFKITFEDSKQCCEAIGASLLANAGSQMKEFCVNSQEERLDSQKMSRFPKTLSREMSKVGCPDISPLEDYVGFEESPVYISLGLDGYFHIQQEKAHAIMEMADKAELSIESGDVVCKSGAATSEKKSPALTNIKNSENDLVKVTRTWQSSRKDLKAASTSKHEQTQIHTEHAGNDSTALTRSGWGPGPGGRRQELLGCYRETQGQMTDANARGTKNSQRVLEKLEENIHMNAKAKISLIKEEGSLKYKSLERQMVARITQLKKEAQKRIREIIKETEAQIAVTTAEYSQKRNITVGETRTRIERIGMMISQEIEASRCKFDIGVGRKQATGILTAGNDDGDRFKTSIPLKGTCFPETSSEPSGE